MMTTIAWMCSQMITLAYDGNGGLQTADEPPVQLGALGRTCDSSSCVPFLSRGMLIRFTVQDKGISIVDGNVKEADLHFKEVANQKKGRADSINKILFQYFARLGRITFDNLIGEMREVGCETQYESMDEMQ